MRIESKGLSVGDIIAAGESANEQWAIQGIYVNDEWEDIAYADTRAEALEVAARYDEWDPKIPHRIRKVAR